MLNIIFSRYYFFVVPVVPYFLVLMLVTVSLFLPARLIAADKPERVITAFLVTAYAYDPGTSEGDPDMGMALCATRCNAFSSDYLNYSKAGGWRIIKTASEEKLRLDLNNPFLAGQCVCTADRYEIRVNELSYPDRNVLGEKIVH